MSKNFSYDPASFKDPDGRVFYKEGRVFRELTPIGATKIRILLEKYFIKEAFSKRTIAFTEYYSPTELVHEEISPISYAYEWSFSMLRDAALLTLDLQLRALKDGYTLKDASHFNIAFRSTKGPVFLDIASFEPYQEGRPWRAYGQFCCAFLFPLFITAYLGIPFQLLLRATMGEIPLSLARSMFGWRYFFERGVFKYILLSAKLESDFSYLLEWIYKNISISLDSTLNNVLKLQELIDNIAVRKSDTIWSNYSATHSYTPEDENAKQEFVRKFASTYAHGLNLVDFGTNIGTYSLIASEYCSQVLSLDSDPSCIDFIYTHVKKNNILPLVYDLTNPSPSQGWQLRERLPLFKRFRSHAFLALALVHHLRITANIPLEHIMTWLVSAGGCGVVEWVEKRDPMVQKLLIAKSDTYCDYTYDHFYTLLRIHFDILDEIELQSGLRKLFMVKAKR